MRNEHVPEKSRTYPVIAAEQSTPRVKNILYIHISANFCYLLSQMNVKHQPNILK